MQIRSGHVFSRDGVEVNPSMHPVLNDIAMTLVAHTGLNVRAIGHTDNQPVFATHFDGILHDKDNLRLQCHKPHEKVGIQVRTIN